MYLCAACLEVAHKSVTHRAGSVVPLVPVASTTELSGQASGAPVLSFVLLLIMCSLPNAFQLGLAVMANDLITMGLEKATIPAILQSSATKYIIQRVAAQSRSLVETMRAQADFWLLNGFLLKYHCTIAEIDADSFSSQSYVYTFTEAKMVSAFIKAFERKLTGPPGSHHEEERHCLGEIQRTSQRAMSPWSTPWYFPQRSFVIILEGEKVMLSPRPDRVQPRTETKRNTEISALIGKLDQKLVKQIDMMTQAADRSGFLFNLRSWLTDETAQRTMMVTNAGSSSVGSALMLEHELKTMGSGLLCYHLCDVSAPTSLEPGELIRVLGSSHTAGTYQERLVQIIQEKGREEVKVPRCIMIDQLDNSTPIAKLILDPVVLGSLPPSIRLLVGLREAAVPLMRAPLSGDALAAPHPILDDGASVAEPDEDEQKELPLINNRKRTHTVMSQDSPPLITIEALEERKWGSEGIARFRESAVDYAAEHAKAKLFVPYLRPQHIKRVRTNFLRYARRLATLLNAEYHLAPEQKRFPPQAGPDGSWCHRIGNVLCVRVVAADQLTEDLRRDLPNSQNAHGDMVYSVPVDGVTYPILPHLARVFLIGHACYLISSTETIRDHSPVSSAIEIADEGLSDPRLATQGGDEGEGKGDGLPLVVGREPIIARLHTEDDRRKAKQTSLFIHQTAELFWYTCNFFLTARECTNLGLVCTYTFVAFQTNPKYWKRAFLNMGTIPLYINPALFDNDVVPIRRWSIIAMIKRRIDQRVHDYNVQVAIALKGTDEKARQERLNQLKGGFLRKEHACPLCFQRVTFQYQLNSSISKKNGFGSVFMACDACCAHQIWSREQAKVIWGFTDGQISTLAHYTMRSSYSALVSKFYCTADLLWLRERKYPYYTGPQGDLQITPKQRARLADLPPSIAMHLTVKEHTVDQQGIVWERRINVATGAIVDHPMQPITGPAMGTILDRTSPVEPAQKRSRSLIPLGVDEALDEPMRSQVESKELRLPASIGGVGVIPQAATLMEGVTPTFVAYHGEEAVPVTSSWIIHPVARAGTYRPAFDPVDA